MIALPNPRVPLVDRYGRATPVFQKLMGGLNAPVPHASVALVDGDGAALPVFRRFLAQVAATPLPSAAVPLTDKEGLPTRPMTMLLAGLP